MLPAGSGRRLATVVRAARHDQSGAAILEFALLLPILMVLVFGCFELGRALLVRQALESAVRVGARSLARVPNPVCRPECSRGARHAVDITRGQIAANTSLPAEAITVAPEPDPPFGTVAMEASAAFNLAVPGPAGLTRWILRARHQEQYVGE